MSAGIEHLPYDIIDNVASYLDIKDYHSFSWTSKRFYRDLQHEGAVKKFLQSRLPSSEAARKALGSSQTGEAWRWFNIHHAQSEALRTASPYSVTMIAHATSFVYDHSILCYITRGPQTTEIRILDLSQAAYTEKVISSNFLQQHVTNKHGPTTSCPLSMAVLGFTMSIVTVVYDAGPNNGSYLFAIDTSDNAAQRILICTRLRSTHKLFARHNDKFLYYGTHSATGSRDYREWLIQGFDLSKKEALTTEPIQLRGFSGSDLHSVIDFKIFNGNFYAITNQIGFESEEINWTSYYCYICFPLESGGKGKSDLQLKTIWRRQDTEGPINDAYTDLSLQVDEATGELILVEIRKEWVRGGSKSHRTCYMQPFDKGLHGLSDDWPSVNPNDQLHRAVEKTDKPRYERNTPKRALKYTHKEFVHGFEGERYEYTPTKTKWKTYSYSGHAFVELVVDDLKIPGSWRRKERMGLRIASRTPSSPLVVTDEGNSRNWRLRPYNRDENDDPVEDNDESNSPVEEDSKENNGPVEDSDEIFSPSQIFKWPSPSGPQGGHLPDELEEMMCPGGKAGHNFQAVLGNEGIVYLVGADSDQYGQRSLIYLSFDPTFGFEGMKRLDGSLARPRQVWQQQKQEQQEQQQKEQKQYNVSSMAIHKKHPMPDDESGLPESPTKRQRFSPETPTGTNQNSGDRADRENHDLVISVASVPNTRDSRYKVQQQGIQQGQEESQASSQSTRVSNRRLYKTVATYRSIKQSWWLR